MKSAIYYAFCCGCCLYIKMKREKGVPLYFLFVVGFKHVKERGANGREKTTKLKENIIKLSQYFGFSGVV